MIIDASFQFKHSDITPKWAGNFWEYGGRRYRSLREMKSTSQWKIENKLTKKLLAEIEDSCKKKTVSVPSAERGHISQ